MTPILPALTINGVDLLRDSNTQNILSFSGGKDSVAMYLLAMENGIDFIPVCADTGNEHELTLDYVRNFHLQTGGPAVQIIQADFTEDMRRKRLFIARDKRVKKRRSVKRDSSTRFTRKVWLGWAVCRA